MFENIELIITIVVWVFAVFIFLGAIMCCIDNFISRDGWRIFRGILAVILGVTVFCKVYGWLESIPFCMMFGGGVAYFISGAGEKSAQEKPRTEKQYGLGQAFLDAYIEEKVIEEAVTNAIRKSKD